MQWLSCKLERAKAVQDIYYSVIKRYDYRPLYKHLWLVPGTILIIIAVKFRRDSNWGIATKFLGNDVLFLLPCRRACGRCVNSWISLHFSHRLSK